MVAFLKKPQGSTYFHQIVDFLNSTHINTPENREIVITATIDGRVKSITEASIRRHLKLENSEGISSLPNTKIFEQLSLMGYVSNSDRLTFHKGRFSPQWRFYIHTILHCLSPKKNDWEQFSSNIATVITTNRTFNFSKMIFEGMLKNLDNKSKFLMYPRFIQIFLNKYKRLLKPHKSTYFAPTITQKLFRNMRRASKGYSGVDVPLFLTMLVQGLILQSDPIISPPLNFIIFKELAQRLYEEELAEVDRAQKEREKQEEATIAFLTEDFDEIQARMDADHELAARLTYEEKEQFTIE
uniref:Synaptobrevin, longin-like domain protein n=1 Tax=Tanacetum cinerariifolium TaxID=118510 RepID=A0A6L2M8M9_TANCI|nr:hypothetical protein [Tanacetum cinerariifolium]